MLQPLQLPLLVPLRSHPGGWPHLPIPRRSLIGTPMIRNLGSLLFFLFSSFFFAFSVYSRPRRAPPSHATPHRVLLFFWRGEELIRAGGEGVLYASPPKDVDVMLRVE